MNTIIIRHQVSDFAAWKSAFDAHAGEREAHGLALLGLHRDVADTNTVTVALRTADLQRADAFLHSEDLRDTMANAGVTSVPDVWVTEDVA